MTEENFAYWLQGYFEISETIKVPISESHLILSESQKAIIRKHISLVRLTKPKSELAASIEALINISNQSVTAVLGAYFANVVNQPVRS